MVSYPAQSQVVSDNSSGGKLDCSDLINSADDETCDTQKQIRSYKKLISMNFLLGNRELDNTQQAVNQIF